jgi:hypothetical protein
MVLRTDCQTALIRLVTQPQETMIRSKLIPYRTMKVTAFRIFRSAQDQDQRVKGNTAGWTKTARTTQQWKEHIFPHLQTSSTFTKLSVTVGAVL